MSAVAQNGEQAAKDYAAAPLRRVPPLRPGDRVALISPSSHLGEGAARALEQAAAILSGWRLRPDPVAAPAPHLYLAGTDSERARRFEELYCDPAVAALFCSRGGYGAARILPLLDGARIAAAPPKAVVGFSDVTALFCYLQAVAGVQAVHGPCLAAPSLLESGTREDDLNALRRLLFSPEERPELRGVPLVPAGPAKVGEGRLVGGNLSVLVTTLGTPWEVETRGAVLFLEDVNEAPYRIDRMITHLRAAGKLDGLRGLALGRFSGCDGTPSGLLDMVLTGLLADAPYPVAKGFAAGHGEPNGALPLGARARLTLAGPEARLEFP